MGGKRDAIPGHYAIRHSAFSIFVQWSIGDEPLDVFPLNDNVECRMLNAKSCAFSRQGETIVARDDVPRRFNIEFR